MVESKTLCLCGVEVKVEWPEPCQAARISSLLRGLFALSNEATPAHGSTVHLEFQSPGMTGARLPLGQEVFQSPTLRVLKTEEGYCLQSGNSALDLDLSLGSGRGALDEEFWALPLYNQREFFLLSLIMLLRPHGLYALHANGLAKTGRGILIVGASGAGKTTLTLGLMSEGWGYLSDDAIMLRKDAGDIEALAFRRGLSFTPATVAHFSQLGALVEESPCLQDGKRLLDAELLYPGSFTPKCNPRVILFPKIVDQRHSQLIPVDEAEALLLLLRQSPGILTDPHWGVEHLEALKLLGQQASSYQFLAGTDVYEEPATVSQLLWEAAEN